MIQMIWMIGKLMFNVHIHPTQPRPQIHQDKTNLVKSRIKHIKLPNFATIWVGNQNIKQKHTFIHHLWCLLISIGIFHQKCISKIKSAYFMPSLEDLIFYLRVLLSFREQFSLKLLSWSFSAGSHFI